MKRSVHHGLTLALLLVAASPVYSQERSGAGAAAPATSSDSIDSSVNEAAKTQNPGSAKSPVVCFKLTMNCIGGDSRKDANGAQPTSGARGQQSARGHDAGGSRSAGTHETTGAEGSRQTLNLTPPDIRTVIPAEELQEPLPTPDQEAIAEEQETVEVKTENETPVVLGGFASLWWALNHPSQAWRIFTPIE
jgi:hypothetical protein